MNTSPDEQAIRKLIDTWMQATKEGDVQTVLGLMTDDAVFMVPGEEPFGKEVFEQALHDMGDTRFEGKGTIVEMQVLGDWAYVRTHLEVTAISPDNEMPMRRTGYTLTILRKESDGTWRLARDANLLAVRN